MFRNKKLGYALLAGLLFIFHLVISPLKQSTLIVPEFSKEKILIGEVTQIISEQPLNFEQQPYRLQRLLISYQEQQIEIDFQTPDAAGSTAEIGDQLIIGHLSDNTGDYYYVIDFWRLSTIGWLALGFLLVLLYVTRFRGVRALTGMVISIYIVFNWIVPFIAQGWPAHWVTLTGLLIIIPSTFIISHGFTKKTAIAMTSTLTVLIITGLIAKLVIQEAKLTGLMQDEILVLLAANPHINFAGLLLAGTLITALGLLDDVTISQTSVVEQLSQVKKNWQWQQLYTQSMAVGKDHIASVINTLVLVFTGASLVTLLLLVYYPRPLMVTLNNELIVIEIVGALVGTTGLILAVPITSLLASLVFTNHKILQSYK